MNEQQMQDSDTIFTAISTGDYDNFDMAKRAVFAIYIPDLSFSRAGISHALKRLEKFYRRPIDGGNQSVIWKFPIANICEVTMPKGAELLSVGEILGGIFLWAKVDPAKELETRCFHVYGTGHNIPSGLNLSFIGTAIIRQGDYVFHIFENKRKNP